MIIDVFYFSIFNYGTCSDRDSFRVSTLCMENQLNRPLKIYNLKFYRLRAISNTRNRLFVCISSQVQISTSIYVNICSDRISFRVNTRCTANPFDRHLKTIN